MIKINENDIFGDYRVISRNFDKKAAATYWNCECIKCKRKRVLRGDSVRKNLKCKKCTDALIGTESNEFIVLSKTDIKSKDKCNVFKCQCKKCGNIEFIASNVLRSQRKHCSCYTKKTTLIDMTGQTYGYLTVLTRDKNEKYMGHENDSYWICRCNNCGSIKSIRGVSLRSGLTKSCGCIKSFGEEEIAKILSENKIPFQREFSFNDLIYKRPLKFDFAIFSEDGVLSHLIEFDGKQHFEKINFFGSEQGFEQIQIRDTIKNNYCIENKIPLIRIKYNEKINLERTMNYETYSCSTERT